MVSVANGATSDGSAYTKGTRSARACCCNRRSICRAISGPAARPSPSSTIPSQSLSKPSGSSLNSGEPHTGARFQAVLLNSSASSMTSKTSTLAKNWYGEVSMSTPNRSNVTSTSSSGPR